MSAYERHRQCSRGASAQVHCTPLSARGVKWNSLVEGEKVNLLYCGSRISVNAIDASPSVHVVFCASHLLCLFLLVLGNLKEFGLLFCTFGHRS